MLNCEIEGKSKFRSVPCHLKGIEQRKFQGGFSTVSLPQIGTFVAAVEFRYLPECTFPDMLIYWCFKGHIYINT